MNKITRAIPRVCEILIKTPASFEKVSKSALIRKCNPLKKTPDEESDCTGEQT